MIKVILLVATLVLAAHAFTDDEYKITFTNWMQEHKRAYSSDEFHYRFGIFRDNMDFVEKWNADPTHTHTVELNLFADMGIEEFKSIYTGAQYDATADLAADAGKEFVADPEVLAGAVDWSTKGMVTPVKDQGQCGSCWSFSTTGAAESINAIKHGSLKSMSEQNLVDCAQPFGPQGCQGGWPDDAFKYIISKKGLNTEAAYPYTAKQGTCHFNAAQVINPISGHAYLASGNENALVTGINTQPVSVCVDVLNSFQMYKSGVYYDAACSSTKLDHAILAVGYTDTYYVVKNSWGTRWGINGYIHMSRNKSNNCGIATKAAVPSV